ncbi:unnamed protein product [Lampetra fluviatilis]
MGADLQCTRAQGPLGFADRQGPSVRQPAIADIMAPADPWRGPSRPAVLPVLLFPVSDIISALEPPNSFSSSS